MGSSLLVPMGQPGPMREGEYEPGPLIRYVSFDATEIQPPAPTYVNIDDTFGIVLVTRTAPVTIQVHARFLRPADKAVIPITKSIVFSGAAYARQEQRFNTGEGFLLSLALSQQTTTFPRHVFVRCWLQRGGGAISASNLPAQLLMADYISQYIPASFPSGIFMHPTDGVGHLFNSASGPGVGLDFQINMNALTRNKLRSLQATLVTSATVANRSILFNVGQLAIPVVALQTASTTVIYRLIPEAQQYTGADGSKVLGLPTECGMDGTMNINSQTTGLQAGDQWTLGNYLNEEWLDF